MAPQIPLKQRLRIVQLWKGGHNKAQIRKITGHSKPTISLWIKRFEKQGGNIRNKRRMTKQFSTTPEQDEAIRELHAQNPSMPLSAIAAQFNVCEKTIRRRLNEDNRNKPKQEGPSIQDDIEEAFRKLDSEVWNTPREEEVKISICRICLQSHEKLLSIESYGLSTAYEQLTGVSVEHDDGLPRELCVECATLLDKYHKFRDKSIKGDYLLRQIYALNDENAVEKSPLEEIEEAVSHLASNIDYSPDITCVDIQPSTKQIKKEIKKELKKEKLENKPTAEANNSIVTQTNKHRDIKIDLDIKVVESDHRLTDDEIGDESFHQSTSSDHNYIEKPKVIKLEIDSDSDQIITDDTQNVLKENFWMRKLSCRDQILKHKQKASLSHYLMSEFKCMDCYDGFKTKMALARHMIVHDPSHGHLLCVVCQSRFNQQNTFNAHVLAAHRFMYNCKTCKCDVHSRKLALKHMKEHLHQEYPNFFPGPEQMNYMIG